MSTLSTWVEDPITQQYEDPRNPAHKGVDLGTPYQTPISELLGGRVASTGYYDWGGEVDVATDVPGYGLLYESYVHLSDIGVAPGDVVAPGDYIGLSGGLDIGDHPTSTRYSNGAHTHYGLFQAIGPARWSLPGNQLDPNPVLAGRHTPSSDDASGPYSSELQGGTLMADTCGPAPSMTDTGAYLAWLGCKAGQSALGVAPGGSSPITNSLGGANAAKGFLTAFGLPSSGSDLLWRAGLTIGGAVLALVGVISFNFGAANKVLSTPVGQAAETGAGAAVGGSAGMAVANKFKSQPPPKVTEAQETPKAVEPAQLPARPVPQLAPPSNPPSRRGPFTQGPFDKGGPTMPLRRRGGQFKKDTEVTG